MKFKYILLSICFIWTVKTYSQKTPSTLIKPAPGVHAPIGKNNPTPFAAAICDESDIRVFPSPNPQSEIHLSINKANSQVLLLSSNTFPISNCIQGAYWSTNGGTSWTGSDALPNGVSGRGDPSTAFDAAGNGYIATLQANSATANPFSYSIQKTSNNGSTWAPQVNATPNTSGIDKEMIAADDKATSPYANSLYGVWSVFGTTDYLQFNKSTNQGSTFSTPQNLVLHWAQGGNVQTGTNGEVYVCWADYTNGNLPEQGIGFYYSTNGGNTFFSNSPNGVVFNLTGIRTTDQGDPLFNGIRVNSFPSMAVDKSNIHPNRIYITYAAKLNGNGKSVILVRYSDDRGAHWTNAINVTIPNATQAFFPWIAVDATDGTVYIVYYAFDQPTGFSTNTYVAYSDNLGVGFVNQRVSDVAHTTAPIPEFGGGYMGDYIGITAYGGKAYASWMDNRTGQWQIYVSQVKGLNMSGPDVVCTSSTYSVSNIASTDQVNWSSSPSGIVSISPTTPNGSSATVTMLQAGNVTITATVTTCTGTVVINKAIHTGGYSSSDYPVSGPSTASCNSYVTYTCPSLPGATNYAWFYPGYPWTYVSGQGTNSITLITPGSNSSGQIGVRVANACDAGGSPGIKFTNVNCGFAPVKTTNFVISPNPASTSITLSSQSSTNSTHQTFDRVNIYNESGLLRKSQVFNKVSSGTIDISNLPIGVYIVEIVSGTFSEKQQLQITRQ